ncbi:MAG: TetR/AcrR family transcriptional regulator [Fimbriimonas sp.]|nr:TetR/AcrR family transcriptional regulator [Fimbriimonas sp.]
MTTVPTRQKILDAAQRLIEKSGLAGLTTKEIAREADCAEGTLFKHFKTKADLQLAVVLENAPIFREKLSQPTAGQSTVAANLGDLATASISYFEKLIPLATSLFANVDLLERHRTEMADQGRGPEDVFALVSKYICEEQQLGRIDRQVQPISAASLLLGPCFHRAFIRQTLGKDIPGPSDRDFVVSIVGVLLDGLVSKTEEAG